MGGAVTPSGRLRLGSALVELLEQLVDERVEARLAARGRDDVEYSSRGPLPAGTSARAFRTTARAMLAAGVEGVRQEGRGRRDRLYVVRGAAWHAWRASSSRARVAPAPVAVSDAELADAALRGAGLRVVPGGRR